MGHERVKWNGGGKLGRNIVLSGGGGRGGGVEPLLTLRNEDDDGYEDFI